MGSITELPSYAYYVVGAVLAAFPFWVVARRAAAAVAIAEAWAMQRAGHPRRSRALLRLIARRCPRTMLPWVRTCEANALLWEGELERSLVLADRLDGSVVPVLIKLEALLFLHRVEEAETLFATHAESLRHAREGAADVLAIEGFLAFYRDDLDTAHEKLEAALGRASRTDPVVSGIRYGLSAVAYRRGETTLSQELLWRTIREGGELFTASLAEQELAERFAGVSVPVRVIAKRPQRPRLVRALFRDLRQGLAVLAFRHAGLERPTVRWERVGRLVVVGALVALALRLVDVERGVEIDFSSVLAVIAPVLLFALASAFAIDRSVERRTMLRILGAFYTVLGPLLVLAFAAARIAVGWSKAAAMGIEALVGLWAVAVFAVLVRKLSHRPADFRGFTRLVLLFAAWVIPLHITAWTPVFLPRMPDARTLASVRESDHERNAELNELAFMQAERLRAAEAALAPERPGVTDLYFIGGAAWSNQDVFLREARSARALFDDRFGTKGRSLLLANDGSARELPAVANVTLRHAVKAVAERMNLEEDVLFLFLTSHGSAEGLGLELGRRSGLRDEVLRPGDLRAMLDEAGIQWRVLVISGCESGVFIEPLKGEQTLIVTASSSDRPSYGCADGNSFTDFGRTLFDDELKHERSFAGAFRGASATIAAREADAGMLASRPQVAEGSRIGAKLRELEERLASEKR